MTVECDGRTFGIHVEGPCRAVVTAEGDVVADATYGPGGWLVQVIIAGLWQSVKRLEGGLLVEDAGREAARTCAALTR
jgi:hypothetical protein